MAAVVIHPSWLDWPETRTLIEAFPKDSLRFVGGCVRDGVLEKPVQDVDAATSVTPEKVMELLKAAGIKAIPTGFDHGTVTAVVGKKPFEVTTLRKDVATDGRRATVAYTSDWQEDAARRDFTMNALYCNANGELFDYFNGVEDAQKGVVRFIGDARARIEEDSLRILRFFCFFAHYGKGTINVEGLAACGSLAGKIKQLSGERIGAEMLKLLVAKNAADVVVLMQQYNVWNHVVPARVGVEALRRLPELLAKIRQKPDAILALAALLRSSDGNLKETVQAIDELWKLSKAQYRELVELCKDIGSVTTPKEQKMLIRTLGKDVFIDHSILLMAEGGEMDEAQGLEAIALARVWDIPVFPLSGDDLIAQGVKPGKEMGLLLKDLEERWEDSGYELSKDQLYQLIIRE